MDSPWQSEGDEGYVYSYVNHALELHAQARFSGATRLSARGNPRTHRPGDGASHGRERVRPCITEGIMTSPRIDVGMYVPAKPPVIDLESATATAERAGLDSVFVWDHLV